MTTIRDIAAKALANADDMTGYLFSDRVTVIEEAFTPIIAEYEKASVAYVDANTSLIAANTALVVENERLQKALQPFAWVSIEGLTSRTEYTTVTMCSEYFHNAATALEDKL